MEIVTKQFIRKPLYVDAVQVTEENFVDIARWCQGIIKNADGSELEFETSSGDSVIEATKKAEATIVPKACYIHVRVHNPKNARQTKAFVGDWLLYTERGYKVYTTKAFEGAFDPAEANGQVQAVKPHVG